MSRTLVTPLLLLLFTGSVVVNGWGSRFDPVKSGVNRRAQGGWTTTMLQAVEFGDDNHGREDHRQDDPTLIEEYRAKLQKMYVSHFDTIRSDDIHDAIRRYQLGRDHPQEQQTSPPRVEAIDFDFFDEHYLGFASDNDEWLADIEEECQIPEELKIIPGEMDPSDVMDFLGIRRAEPLRRVRDWE